MPRNLTFPIFSAVVVLAIGAAYLGIAADSHRQPLDGVWRASFAVDSSTRPETKSGQRVDGQLALHTGTPPEPRTDVPWQAAFVGSFEIPFASTLGVVLPKGRPPAFAIRRGRDSVEVFLGQPCCDAGGLWAFGHIRGDTVTGDWDLDIDGVLVRGSFRLERIAGLSGRAPDVALQRTGG